MYHSEFINEDGAFVLEFSLKGKKRELCQLGVLALCFIAGMFVFSAYTSPLYPYYWGTDSSIFALLGKGILEGKTLYLDLFDHKGPFIFFFNALGQLMGGRTGIWGLQCVFGLLTLALLYNILKLLHPEDSPITWKTCTCVFVAGYAYFFYTFERGNLTEEYSLLFIACSLFLLVKYARNAEQCPCHPPKYAFVYGISLAVLALTRLNNAVTICAGILAVFLYLVCRKEYVNLLRNLVAGLLGIAVVAVPVFAYFWYRSALEEMLYAAFLHNFQIYGNTSQKSFMEAPFVFIILYFPMAVCCLLFAVNFLKNRKLYFLDFLLGCVLLINILGLWIANRFPHYFTIFVPVYFVFLCRYLTLSKKSICTWAVVCCMALSLAANGYYSFWNVINNNFIMGTVEAEYEAISEDFARIPEDERDSVIGYQISAYHYIYGDIIPCYKYYTLQETWSITSTHILGEFMDWVRTEKPLWVITSGQEYNTEMNEILSQSYEFQFGNDYILFYRLSE